MKPADRIKSCDMVASGPTLVREFTFGPGEATPWRRHSAGSTQPIVDMTAIEIAFRARGAS